MIIVKPIVQEAFVIIVDGKDSIEQFKTLVQRAANLWPDATPEIKEFADLITNGEIFQDYRSQDTSPRKNGITLVDEKGNRTEAEWVTYGLSINTKGK